MSSKIYQKVNNGLKLLNSAPSGVMGNYWNTRLSTFRIGTWIDGTPIYREYFYDNASYDHTYYTIGSQKTQYPLDGKYFAAYGTQVFRFSSTQTFTNYTGFKVSGDVSNSTILITVQQGRSFATTQSASTYYYVDYSSGVSSGITSSDNGKLYQIKNKQCSPIIFSQDSTVTDYGDFSSSIIPVGTKGDKNIYREIFIREYGNTSSMYLKYIPTDPYIKAYSWKLASDGQLTISTHHKLYLTPSNTVYISSSLSELSEGDKMTTVVEYIKD